MAPDVPYSRQNTRLRACDYLACLSFYYHQFRGSFPLFYVLPKILRDFSKTTKIGKPEYGECFWFRFKFQ